MSDPNTESAPATSTADIVRGVIEQSESEPVAESTPVETAAPPTETAAPVELSPAEKFLLEKGHKAVKEDGRPVWLPHKTVMKMLDDYVGTHRSTWDSSLSTIQQERDKLKADLEELYRDARGENTDLLIQRLAKIDPRYERYLKPATPAPAATPSPEQDPEPGPDLDLGNGQMTFSVDGLKKLRAWERRQFQREIDERLKPIAEREKAAKEAEAKSKWEQDRQAEHRALMTEAQTWPYFGKFPEDGSLTDFQKAVLEEMKADNSVDLKGAYIKVMGKRYAQDDTIKRAQFAKEASEAAERATPTITRPGSVPAKVKPKDNRSIVAEIVANSERG